MPKRIIKTLQGDIVLEVEKTPYFSKAEVDFANESMAKRAETMNKYLKSL